MVSLDARDPGTGRRGSVAGAGVLPLAFMPAVAAVLLLTSACEGAEPSDGTNPAEDESAKAPTESPTPPSPSPQPDESDPAAASDGGNRRSEDAGASLNIRYKEARLLGNMPSEKPLKLEARRENPRVAVIMENLDTYCTPIPSFRAHAKDARIRVHLVPPDDPPKCVGPHLVKLRVELPDGDPIQRVQILDENGKELAATKIEG